MSNQIATLCWSCARATGHCSWSDGSFTPVPGWKAIKTVIRSDPNKKQNAMDSFLVLDCPLYDDDVDRYSKTRKEELKWYRKRE